MAKANNFAQQVVVVSQLLVTFSNIISRRDVMATEYAKRLNREFKRSGSKMRIVSAPKMTAKDYKNYNLMIQKIDSQVERNAVIRMRSFFCNRT